MKTFADHGPCRVPKDFTPIGPIDNNEHGPLSIHKCGACNRFFVKKDEDATWSSEYRLQHTDPILYKRMLSVYKEATEK